MKKLLRNLIEEDIEKILDNNKIKKKNFFFLFLYYLLENPDRIDLAEIGKVADEFSDEYESFLKNFELELIESNGEIIDVLKSAIPKFNKKIAYVLDKIDKIKENANHTHNFN